MTATRTDARERVKPATQDALSMLKADHEGVNQLFADYEKTPSVSRKKALVAEICKVLSVHAQIKQEIFYPEVKSALQDESLIHATTVENSGVTDLIANLQGVQPHGAIYDAQVKVLSEHVNQHVEEAQNGMFQKIKASSLDMVEVGARMTARKEDLLKQEQHYEIGPQGVNSAGAAR